MMKTNKSLLEIHLAVLLFGLSGLFGKLIVLPAIMIVFGRVVFASVFLLAVLLALKKPLLLDKLKDYAVMAGMGALLAVHWSTFFFAIQLSTVAIGLLTFSTFPVFVAFLEPYFFKEKRSVREIVVALVAFGGIILVIPEFELSSQLTQGGFWGVLSGLTFALLSLLNRKYVKAYPGMVVAFYEQAVAAVLLIPYFVIQQPLIQAGDLILLVLLGIVFTGMAHSLFINGLQDVKTQTAAIISCLEPVYGIAFAALYLQELPGIRELAGGVIILAAVCYSTVWNNQHGNNPSVKN